MQTDAVGANRTVTVAVESWTALARKSYVPPIQKRPSATTPSVANRDTLLWRFWANIQEGSLIHMLFPEWTNWHASCFIFGT